MMIALITMLSEIPSLGMLNCLVVADSRTLLTSHRRPEGILKDLLAH